MFSLLGGRGAGREARRRRAPTAQVEFHRARKLFQFSEKLLVTRDVPGAAGEALLDGVIEATGADKGFVISARHADRGARGSATSARSDVARRGACSLGLDPAVIRRAGTSTVDNAVDDTLFRSAASVMNPALSSVMCAAPSPTATRWGSSTSANDRIAKVFDPRSLNILAVFASQASLILKGVLLETLRQGNAELEKKLKEQRFREIIGSCDRWSRCSQRCEGGADGRVGAHHGETGTDGASSRA